MTDSPLPGVRRACVIAALLLLAGCRTYGGYGSEEQLYSEIQEANRLFADDLTRRRAELDLLTQAAGANPALAPYAEQYRNAVLVHDAVLSELQGTAEALEGEDYRPLRRAYGALIAQQQMIERQYQSVLRGMEQLPDSLQAGLLRAGAQSRYMVVPPYFNRVRFAADTTSLVETLAAAGRLPAFQPGAAPADSVDAPAPGAPAASAPDTSAATHPHQ